MTKLLLDDNPDVRVVAINGCFSVLKELWLIIPSNRINDIIKIVVRDLAFDATSPKVRLASIKGLTRLLGNVRTHIYLKAVLPKVSLCLHDVNDGVRSAMVEMLHVTKGIKVMYLHHCNRLDYFIMPRNTGRVLVFLHPRQFDIGTSAPWIRSWPDWIWTLISPSTPRS